MANTSIKEAFAQFWQHVIARTGEMIDQANEYTDEKIAELGGGGGYVLHTARASATGNTVRITPSP